MATITMAVGTEMPTTIPAIAAPEVPVSSFEVLLSPV